MRKNEFDDMLQFVAFKLKKSGAGNYIYALLNKKRYPNVF